MASAIEPATGPTSVTELPGTTISAPAPRMLSWLSTCKFSSQQRAGSTDQTRTRPPAAPPAPPAPPTSSVAWSSTTCGAGLVLPVLLRITYSSRSDEQAAAAIRLTAP